MSNPCKACNDPNRDELERLIWLGNVTVAEAAKRVGMPYEEYWTHLQKHIPVAKDKVDSVDLSQTLRYMLKRLKTRCDTLIGLPINGSDERSISSQVRLLKDIVMDIAKLEHQLDESPMLQINNLMLQQTEIVGFLTSNLCSDCRIKFMEYLGHGLKMAGPEPERAITQTA